MITVNILKPYKLTIYTIYNIISSGEDKMWDIILDTLIDALKLLPFLFLAFYVIELLEHKLSNKTEKIIKKSGKYGPFIGALLGAFPQCGFSVLATNFYITRIISLGTLISIYLSTSDEMLPILISHKANILSILLIILIKIFIGMLSGFIIDYIIRKNKKETINYNLCDDDNCDCEKHGPFVSALIHTLKTILFIVIISFILNIIMNYKGTEYLEKLFLKDSLFSPFISSIVGLIPNCGASVLITELYINNAISFGSLIAGLLTGSGVAILVLFKNNKNLKENFKILLIIYLIGSISGLIINLINLL